MSHGVQLLIASACAVLTTWLTMRFWLSWFARRDETETRELRAQREEFEAHIKEREAWWRDQLREREAWWRDQLRSVSATRGWIADAKQAIEVARADLNEKTGGK